jgi:hypothetical protein
VDRGSLGLLCCCFAHGAVMRRSQDGREMLIIVFGRLYLMECWMFWIMNEVMATYHGWTRQRKKRKTKKRHFRRRDTRLMGDSWSGINVSSGMSDRPILYMQMANTAVLGIVADRLPLNPFPSSHPSSAQQLDQLHQLLDPPLLLHPALVLRQLLQRHPLLLVPSHHLPLLESQ